MATAGNTSKPTNTQEAWGLNSINQMAQAVTLPGGGPWLITTLHVWLGGWNSSPTTRLCLWDAAGNLLAQSGSFAATNHGALANGASSLHSAAISPVVVGGGVTVYVGFHRHSDHPMQNGRYSSGAHLHDVAGDSPESLSGFSTDGAGGLGAFLEYTASNSAPTVPTHLYPTGLQNLGRSVNYGWKHNDPDGNPIASSHWQLWNSAQSVMFDEVSGFAVEAMVRTLPAGLNATSEFTWRVRTYDGALWSPWTAFQLFRPNTPPNPPFINAVPTNTLTPTFTGGGSDPDPGNSLVTVQYEVYRSSDGHQMWFSPPDGGAFAGVVYAGEALSYGVQYQVRARTRDNWGAWSSWSGYTYWTPVLPTGPTLSPNTSASKQDTLTPNLTITHGSAFTDHELEIYLPGGVTPVFINSPAPYASTTSKIVVPSGLSWGQRYEYRARVLVGGAFTAWSQLATFQTNAEPTAPTLDMPGSSLSPSGERVVTTLTPVLKAIFNDADKVPYGDAPSAASLEVRNNATDALVNTLTSTAEEVTYSGTALAFGTTYKWRKRYTDNAGRQGPFSAYQTFRPTRAPTATLTAPAAASVVAESTPVLDWAFTSLDGKAQYSYRVTIRDKGPTGANFANPAPVYDSGEIISSTSQHEVPRNTLENGHDYEWSVIVKDTDGLAYTLS